MTSLIRGMFGLALKSNDFLQFAVLTGCLRVSKESIFTEIKEWYDGYRFGEADIYCPWDVINHIDHLLDNSNAKPQAYWINTSGNGQTL